MGKSKIEWCDKTWNLVTGCTKVSAGCRSCYAERMSKRLAGRCGYPAENPFAVTLHPERLAEPLKWKKPSRIFVCSMGDLFHENVPVHYVDKVLRAIDRASHHTYLLLSKRPQNFKEYLRDALKFRPNVYLGVSVEDQATADERIPLLLQTPAAKRFVSYEPAIGPVDFTNIPIYSIGALHRCNVLRGYGGWGDYDRSKYRLDQIIMGGETGPGARPMHPDWARSVRDQCKAAGVPFFFKQWGEWIHESQPQCPNLSYDGSTKVHEWGGMANHSFRVGKKAAGCLLDGQEHKEMPE